MATDEGFVSIERGLGPNGRVALVRFDRGDSINALSPAAMRELREAARSFEDDIETSVVVLAGSLRAFSAGFDLKDGEREAASADGLGALRRSIAAGPRMCRAWYDMEQVTIAAIEGFCIGGGVALAVSLDFRVAGRGAHFRVPEVDLGMNMSWGSIPRMLQLMGPARTKQAVMLASERIYAEQAYEWGLLEHLAEDGSALTAAMALAGRLAAEPPLPLKMTKMSVNRLAGAHDDLASHMDLDQFVLTTMSDDSAEGIAAFLERRPAHFRGR